MKIVNESEAKTRLSHLLDLVASEEEIIIARAGRPMAKLIPYRVKPKSRTPGCWKGKVKIANDFDATSAVISRAFQN